MSKTTPAKQGASKSAAKPVKRANRLVGVDEALGKMLDPVFKKRGFASRDLIDHWPAIVPPPYDKESLPDRLHWPRSQAGAEGAVLYVRCTAAQRLALSHEGHVIAQAVNRYFGYVLVGAVKLSAEPFTPRSDARDQSAPEPTPQVQREVQTTLANVNDEGVREALRRLGHGLLSRKR